MNKIDEIHRMLDVIAAKKNINGHVVEMTPGIFKLDGVISVPFALDDNQKRDCYQFVIDFVKDTFIMWAYNESGHNGDSYGGYNKTLDWPLVEVGYEQIKHLLRKQIEIDLAQEAKDKLNAAIESKIKWLLQ